MSMNASRQKTPAVLKKRRILSDGIVCAIGIILAAVPVFAANSLQLQDSISLALKNDTAYVIACEKENESRARINEAWGKLWPDLSSDVSGSRFGADAGLQSQSYGQYDINIIKGSLTINPGVFYETLKSSREGYIASVNDERRFRSEITSRVIRLYYGVILNTSIVELKKNSVAALEENLRIVKAGTNSGAQTNLDLLRAKVTVANEKSHLIAAENDFRMTSSALNVIMGQNINAPISISSDPMTVDLSDIAVYVSPGNDDENFTELLSEALRNRPEIIQLRAKKNMALAGADINRSLYIWPTFFVNGRYGMSETLKKESDSSTGDPQTDAIIKMIGDSFSPTGWNKSWNVTVGALYRWGSLSPFDSSQSRTDENVSLGKQVDSEMDGFVKQLGLDIQQGLLKLHAAANTLQTQKENISLAEEYFRVASIQFRNGMIDNAKFLDANVALQSAKTLYVQSQFDLQTAKADINRAVGKDIFVF